MKYHFLLSQYLVRWWFNHNVLDSHSFVHEFLYEYAGMCLVGNSYLVHCAD